MLQFFFPCESLNQIYILGLITSVLGIRSHFRFKRIIALSQRNNGTGNKTIVTRLAYFKDMNALVSLILFSYSASIILLCADGLTTAKIINRNKFATDTVIANANICTVFLCLLLVSRTQFQIEYILTEYLSPTLDLYFSSSSSIYTRWQRLNQYSK